MPFALDANPTPSELSEAVNYLLGNFVSGLSADPNTGQISSSTGVVGYLYKYLAVKYADSFDGSVNFSNTPTNRQYYGVRNSNDPVESTNYADYIWTKVTGGFGTTKFLWYLTTGGRQIQLAVATAAPNTGWAQDGGTSIDLDVLTGSASSPANFVVIRVANSSAAPTDAECISAIGRTPIMDDMCTVNYNSGLASIQYKYTTGWAIFQSYITGDIIVANSIVGNNIAANTITAGKMNVSQLSAISADLGAVTAGSMNINNKFIVASDGSTTIQSGTTGARVYIANNVIKVYDSGGTLRVKIGDLSA